MLQSLTLFNLAKHHSRRFFTKKITIAKWELNAFGLGMFTLGALVGLYVLATGLFLPKTLAAISWTQNDWSGGSGSSTTNQYSTLSNTNTGTGNQILLLNTDKLTNTGFESDLSSWPSPFSATGGIITSSGGYTIHTFLSSGTFTPSASTNIEALVVAGGGGGGAAYGGGGGAGGLIYNSAFTVTAQAYSVTVGGGGAGAPAVNSANVGANGGNSIFSSLAAVGGGGGGGYLPRGGKSGVDGGSGGGGEFEGTGGVGTSGQGHDGGTASTYPNVGGGGGGGAGASGANGTSTTGGNGGDGLPYSISGSSVLYAGGGGGGTYQGGVAGAGGNGGGGAGASGSGNNPGVDGTANTGGGGGGSGYLNTTLKGGNGGSGVVIIRYPQFMVARDTGTKYVGLASAKIVTGAASQNFTQSINVGDTNNYNLVAYADIDGSTAVDATYIQLYYNGAALTTTYASVGSGWYKLSATVVGANASRQYGVQIKANKTVYVDNLSLNSYASSGTLTSSIFDTSQLSAWGTLSYSATLPSGTAVMIKVRSSNSVTMLGATAFSSCTAIANNANLSTGGCVVDGDRYVQYQVTESTTDNSITPSFASVSISYSAFDTVPPATNASTIVMKTAVAGRVISYDAWNNSSQPYFSWTAGVDNGGGSGIKGYCIYLGTDPAGDPVSAKGILGSSPVSINGGPCAFISPGNSLDLSEDGLLASSLVSNQTYYLMVKAIDYGGNTFLGSPASFQFKNDTIAPTNVAYISMPSQSFSNVADMNFSWPTTGGLASGDGQSGVLGWQYQINSTTGRWLGTAHNATLNMDYIPASDSFYILSQSQDGGSIAVGSNTIYFRTVDLAGNASSDGTVRTGSLSYGGASPTFDNTARVTITPSVATSNTFTASWPTATASGGGSVAAYYYMVNTPPPSTLATLQANKATYINNGVSTTISARSLPNVNRGANTIYVVAIDSATTPNYSPSNVASGTFTLNSTDPDNVNSLVASDSSIKSSQQWNVTLTWVAPSYQGAGNLAYEVQRSTDGVTFSSVGSTSSLFYVDTTPESRLYYYRVYTKDGANGQSSGTNAVTLTPTGKFTSPAALTSQPKVTVVSTKKATIEWTTDRVSDSKIAFGKESGKYNLTQPSVPGQMTLHTVELTNLEPGTEYFYKANWTDGDGNTGVSTEKTFTTEAPPSVKDVVVKNVSLSSATLNFSSTGASQVKIYYGISTSFGGVKQIDTSESESSYLIELANLNDGAKYYYKINALDSDGDEYEGTVLDFTTLPRPKITNVRLQSVVNTAQSAEQVSWTSNTEISSIVSYYPEGQPSQSSDEVQSPLVKGEHVVVLHGLEADQAYVLVVRGRDKVGNEAISDAQRFTTATDTRPPLVTGLKVESSKAATGTQQSQLVVSWNTDEPSTSEVEYGEGTGATYAQRTPEDANYTTNHLVVIPGLSTSKVYHLHVVAKDRAGNTGMSVDMVTITPKATNSAFGLVLNNLLDAFGFLGRLNIQ